MDWLLKLFAGNPVTMLYMAGAIFLAGAASGGSGAWWVQGLRLEAATSRTVVVQGKYDAFVSEVRLTGERMRDNAIQQAALDKAKKEKIDAQNKTAVALLNQRISSMRYDADNSGRYRLPAPAPGSKRPDLACFNRAELERADREILERLRAIADQGDAATVDLDTAKEWAADTRTK